MRKKFFYRLVSTVNILIVWLMNILRNNKLSFQPYLFIKVNLKIKGKLNSLKFEEKSEIKKTKIIVTGDQNVIIIKNNAFISNLKLIIKGSGNYVEIGENTRISKLEVTINSNSSKLIIGKDTTISGFSEMIIKENKDLIIGDDCMISRNVIFRTSDSHSIIDKKTHKRINFAKNISIGNHVWIGQNVSLLKGTHINDNNIIASNTTVTKPITDTNVVIGNTPAKVLKTSVNWDRKLINMEDYTI